jgi:sugar phosphate isomerase/epimerase
VIVSSLTLSGSPAGEVPRFTFEARVAAAGAAGFDGIGFMTSDYEAARARGLTDADMRAILAHHGVALDEIEFLYGWGVDDEWTESGRHGEAVAYAMADAFGSRHVNAGSFLPKGTLGSVERTAEGFAGLCDRAAEHGLLVALEFLPWSDIPNAAAAWDIVVRAGRPNGGLLVDVCHLFRSGCDAASLKAFPAESVKAVQFADALARPAGDLEAEAIGQRRLPGEGELDLVGFVQALDAMGVDVPVSVEIISPEIQALPVDEAGARAYAATRRVLSAARG